MYEYVTMTYTFLYHSLFLTLLRYTVHHKMAKGVSTKEIIVTSGSLSLRLPYLPPRPKKRKRKRKAFPEKGSYRLIIKEAKKVKGLTHKECIELFSSLYKSPI